MLLETGNCHFKSIGWGSQMNVISLKLGLSLTPLHIPGLEIRHFEINPVQGRQKGA